jgi:hypothetical protein
VTKWAKSWAGSRNAAALALPLDGEQFGRRRSGQAKAA